jgi:GDP-mannose 4,6-dehydratase
MKKILITGFSGMVGSHLADLILKKTNWKIIGACRWRSPLDNIKHLSDVINSGKIKLRYMDLNDYSSIFDVIQDEKPDMISHLAAQSFPKSSFSEREITYNTNIIGTDRLLDAIRKCKINPVIHICSSSEIFGRVKKKDLPISENNTFHPASPYAISKIGTDLIAKFYFEAYNLKIVTTRMFTHTGPRRSDFFAESSFAKQIALIENNKQKNLYVGNVNSLRTIADVRDAVEAYYQILKNTKKFGEAYNIGGNYSCKISDILKYLISKTKIKNIKIKIDKNRIRPIDADLQIPNTKKFRKNYKWKPKIKFEKTMDDLLEYWRQKIHVEKNYINR